MGRLQWVRLDTDIDDLPEAITAGYHGCSVWYALARISGQFGLEGVIPTRFANPAYLARRLGAPVDAMQAGLDAIVATGIATRDNTNAIVIDMERFISPAVTMMRERRAAEKADKAKQNITNHNGDDPLVTVSNGNATGHYGTEHNGTLQNRTDSSPCSPPSRGDVKESEGEPETKPKVKAKKVKQPSKVAQEVVAIYHEECPNLPKVRVVNDELDQRINCRYQDLGADLDKVREFFRDIVSPSDFLNNRSHSRDGHGFQASLPWLMGPVNFSKVANGAYQNKRNQYEQRLWELEHDQEAV